MTPIIEELESLLLDWEERQLDDAGIERVREILRSDEEARDWFARRQAISAALSLDSNAGFQVEAFETSVNSTPSQPIAPERQEFIRVRGWLALAAGLMICLLAGRWAYLEATRDTIASEIETPSNSPLGRDNDQEATSQGIAIVTRLVDVEWGQDQAPMSIGAAVEPGRFSIDSGYAQIEFFCGATVVLEGPAELDLKSPTLARVHQGRLRAQVPPAARGFSLEVDDLKVVDLGTEFGLAVSAEGADVQVFDGEVEIHPTNEKTQRLTTGQAVSRTAEGQLQTSVVTPDHFVDIAALERRQQDQQSHRYSRWQEWSEKLRSDSRLITYYAFDGSDGWQRRLECDLVPANSELDGAIVGAKEVDGRWESKRALEFKQPGDRVRVQIPGEFGSLTFACWVKIDSLDRWYNSLFLTDNYNRGEPHWQILDSGQMFFSVRSKPDDAVGPVAKGPSHHVVLSPPFWKPSMSGQWLFLATTYDAVAGRTTHYLNGDVLHSEEIPSMLVMKTTRIGSASIGNWSLPTKPDAEFAIRNLNGSLDEFAIFSAALSADEIQEMYEHGRP